MLKDNHIMLFTEFLLFLYIDQKVRIVGIEVVNSHPFEITDLLSKGAVNPRP